MTNQVFQAEGAYICWQSQGKSNYLVVVRNGKEYPYATLSDVVYDACTAGWFEELEDMPEELLTEHRENLEDDDWEEMRDQAESPPSEETALYVLESAIEYCEERDYLMALAFSNAAVKHLQAVLTEQRAADPANASQAAGSQYSDKYVELLTSLATDVSTSLAGGYLTRALDEARTLGNISELVRAVEQNRQSEAATARTNGAARFLDWDGKDAEVFLDRCVQGDEKALLMAATTANSSFIEQVSQG